MKDKIADRPAADDSKAVTFDEAERVGAFELASRWAGRLSWSFGDRAAPGDLAELVCWHMADCRSCESRAI